MNSFFEPLNSVISLACRMAAQKIVSGEMDQFEAFEYADKLTHAILETDEYKQAQQECINKLADVKDIKFGDING